MKRDWGHLARSLVCVAGPAFLACSAGCAGSRSQTGIRIGDETLKQFKAGVTTESWLLAVLGPPSSSSIVSTVENTKVYRYSLGESATGFLSLLSGGASRNTSVIYFILTDVIVTRFWADRATERTLLGKPVEQPSGEKQEM